VVQNVGIIYTQNAEYFGTLKRPNVFKFHEGLPNNNHINQGHIQSKILGGDTVLLQYKRNIHYLHIRVFLILINNNQ